MHAREGLQLIHSPVGGALQTRAALPKFPKSLQLSYNSAKKGLKSFFTIIFFLFFFFFLLLFKYS